jgi:hypothetical protein
MSWSPTHVVVVASAILVSLAGCSGASAPAPGLTSDEYAQIIREKQDFDWNRTNLRAELRPEIGLTVLTEPQSFGSALVTCLNSQGADDFTYDHGTVTYTPRSGELGSSSSTEEQVFAQELNDQTTIDMYYCSEKYQVDPSIVPLLTSRQLDYIYDYYVTSLVPCLREHGVKVTSAPSRLLFAPPGQHELTWNPYLSANLATVSQVADCAPMPRGYDYAFEL